MEPCDAKKVALGDADPVTLLPMEDINSTFIPRVLLRSNILNDSREQNRGKAKATGILHFFGARTVTA